MFFVLFVLNPSVKALAQQSDDDYNIDLDPVYSEPIEVKNNQIAPQNMTNRLPRKKITESSSGTQQPIYILNQSNPTASALNSNDVKSQLKNESDLTATQVQKQPTTVIEAQPLTESRAELIRKARQDSELHTEQKIVEKLESSRLEDEKRRADILFGDKFSHLNESNNAQNGTVNVIQQQSAAARDVVTPVQVTSPSIDKVLDEENELNQGYRKGKNNFGHSSKVIFSNDFDSDSNNSTNDSQSYFSALIGTSEFNKASNVQGLFATGFGLGVAYQSRLLVEADFIYSQFERNYPQLTTIDQYTVMAQLKYQILSELIRPVVGAALSYSYRTFDDSFQSFNNPYYYNNNNADYNTSSNTLDTGLLAGIDVAPNDSFSIGVEYRYMWNLTHKTNGYYPTFYSNQQSIDNLNYYILSLNTKFMF